jgi:pimeloyl-ACP methyl ester carboxylesterase
VVGVEVWAGEAGQAGVVGIRGDTITDMTTLLLIHGGLWEDGMDAERFWVAPGIAGGLRQRGFEVLTPDRSPRAPSWTVEVDHLLTAVPDLTSPGSGRQVTLLAGSNGCSVAVRLAVALPERVDRLLLAWPATACDSAVDARTRSGLLDLGATPDVIDQLLSGQTLRGVSDAELAALPMPVGVLPSAIDNKFHQRRTVDALLRLVQDGDELPGCPEPPRPDFPAHLDGFLTAVAEFAVS